jgi:hypothetical protein
MTVDAWLQAATADAERRGLSELKPLLEALARAMSALRAADFSLRPSALSDESPQDPGHDFD